MPKRKVLVSGRKLEEHKREILKPLKTKRAGLKENQKKLKKRRRRPKKNVI